MTFIKAENMSYPACTLPKGGAGVAASGVARLCNKKVVENVRTSLVDIAGCVGTAFLWPTMSVYLSLTHYVSIALHIFPTSSLLKFPAS